ncbi:hypothetical protein LLH23_19900 [bacterium]|nr:hypothetical protein [bacterium]
MDTPTADFITLLQRWPRFARQYFWDDPARPELGCFGTGYNSWGVQTNQKFVGAMCVLAMAPELDEAAAEISRDEIADLALRGLRYSLASHVSGDHHCSDGTQWGHTWISGLGVERMLHGTSAMKERLADADLAGLRRMLCSEADWLLDYEIQGTLWARDGGNKPESNIWNGAICCRAALLYPDEAHAADWLEKAHCFFINGISLPADAQDETIVAGKPVRERHVGPNLFPRYALDHHGYLNVGYMVICLSNIAMLHYGLLAEGHTAPDSLTWHAGELWELVRQLTFDNGRLLRMGGDSRQRYCYCQDYLLPTLWYCAEVLGDERAAHLEAQALELIRREQAFNGDGSFLSKRLHRIREENPYYYTRLEADKAVVLSMNATWRRLSGRGLSPDGPESREGADPVSAPAGVSPLRPAGAGLRGQTPDADTPVAWHEPEHGAVFVRSARRFASWSWRASEPPQGMCLPPDNGHFAEWCENMGGSVRVAGGQGKRTVLRHEERPFDGGFVTTGVMSDCTKAYFAEGWTYPAQVPHQLAVAALPDDRTMVVLEHCAVSIRTYLSEAKGLKLNVANDLFTGFERRYASEGGSIVRRGEDMGALKLGGTWANVDGRLGVVGVYGSDEVWLHQAGQRRASGYGESLYYDELCAPCRVGLWDVPAGTVVLDCGNVVLSGADAQETADVAAGVQRLAASHDDLRAVLVPGADGKRYVLVANFGAEAADGTVGISEADAILDVVTREDGWTSGPELFVSLQAGGATLFCVT